MSGIPGSAGTRGPKSQRLLSSAAMSDSALDPTTRQTCVLGEVDPFLARLLQRYAEKSGLYIQRAQTGEDVLGLAQACHPALIILDPELPGKVRGWEAVQALQNNNLTRSIPVILCTWLLKADASALVGYALPYLQKPELHYEDFAAALVEAGVHLDCEHDEQ